MDLLFKQEANSWPYSVREERQSLATSLRDKLAEAERLILQLRRDNAESYLQLLDSIDECFSQLESSGLDLRPEQARWGSLQSKLRSEAGRVSARSCKCWRFCSSCAKPIFLPTECGGG